MKIITYHIGTINPNEITITVQYTAKKKNIFERAIDFIKLPYPFF